MTKTDIKSQIKISTILFALFQLIFVGFAYSQTTKKLDVGEFHTISVNSDFDVIIRQSNVQEVEAKVDPEVWPNCNIWVDNGVLHVDYKSQPGKKSVMDKLEKSIKGPKMELYVTAVKLNKIIANGNGKIKSENSLNSGNLIIELNGDGEIDLDVKSSRVKASILGNGQITLSGYGDSLDLLSSGGSTFKGLNFDAKNVKASIHGSETICQVSVSQSLNVSLFGAGEFFYKGSPKTIEKSLFGQGKILQR